LNPILTSWQFSTITPSTSWVLPDGCRDLIVRLDPQKAPDCFVSKLSDSAYAVESSAGVAFVGFRLQPGAIIQEKLLLASINPNHAHELSPAKDLIAQFVRVDEDVSQALAALAASSTVQAAARGCGLSERSLERLIAAKTGRTPNYWRCLARVRRAAAALATAKSLAEIAVNENYADQAHLQREFKRWFGTTPARFKQQPELLATAMESGYI
jgi:AraC-like DNA-binding protein